MAEAPRSDVRIVAVAEDQWELVSWLWQAYRNDMAHMLVGSFPYPDGRYRHGPLDLHPGSTDHAGQIAWAHHPQIDEPAPVGFALVDGLTRERRSITAFWVAPGARRTGLGRTLAMQVITCYDGPWVIAFQHDNETAGAFWRAVATEAWGDNWTEEQRAVPGRPDVPPDHWITTT